MARWSRGMILGSGTRSSPAFKSRTSPINLMKFLGARKIIKILYRFVLRKFKRKY